MKKISITAIIIVLSLASSCDNKTVVNQQRNLYSDLTFIRHGIPAYHAVTYDYQCDGRTILTVELKEPVTVAVASKPEKWGYFQFPVIYRSTEGRLVATWNMAEDDPSGYGSEPVFKVSSDNGKTWDVSSQPAPPFAGYCSGALFLPETGEHISICTPASIKLTAAQIPTKIATKGEYDFYRLNQLPAELQGVYLNKWDKNGTLTEIHASLDDPNALRYSYNGLFSVVWWGDMKRLPDYSVFAGIYPTTYESENGEVCTSSVSFYRSADHGKSWQIRGKIPYSYDPVADPRGDKRTVFGFTEPAFEILPDGTFLCVLRTSDEHGISPMYLSRSSDQGATWSQPEAFTPNGVLPRLLQLDNGTLVLSSGRPGVQLRFSVSGKGQEWTLPFEILPFEDDERILHHSISCGYTGLLASGPDSFLLIYSDFKHLNQDGEERKAIKIREIKVTYPKNNQSRTAPWTVEQANQWSQKWGWLRGCNFQPSTAINQLEMWQADTFDPTTIDRELGWAAAIGMNCMRVYLHHAAWEVDKDGFKKRMAQYMDIADKHGIATIFVFFDDCGNPTYSAGKQPEPKQGFHNSGWVRDPGDLLFEKPALSGVLETYIKDILTTFKDDKRIVLWDLYNEPGSGGYLDKSLNLLQKAFEWAWTVNPSQPLSVGVWESISTNIDLSKINTFSIAHADVITYHSYRDLTKHKETVDVLKRYGRPMICTEYMARRLNSTFQEIMPMLKAEHIGAINWGLVAGKTNTIFGWGEPLPEVTEPPLWFHDIFRKNGKPFSQEEVDFIKSLGRQ